jgi:hypothetical protein
VSWDLYVLPVDHGENASQWLEENADKLDAEAARHHADAIRARRPELELSGPSASGYELTLPEDSGLPLEVGLYGTHASIGVAYWDLGERTNEVAEIIVDVVDVLTEANKWVTYDSQDDRILRPEEVRTAFGSGHDYGVGIIHDVQGENEKPKRKRRFKIF